MEQGTRAQKREERVRQLASTRFKCDARRGGDTCARTRLRQLLTLGADVAGPSDAMVVGLFASGVGAFVELRCPTYPISLRFVLPNYETEVRRRREDVGAREGTT